MTFKDPATHLYHSLSTSRSTQIDRLRLIRDDITACNFLELERNPSPRLRVVYHVATWPVLAETTTTLAIPVLYFNVYEINETGQLDLITDVVRIVELLVPEIYKSQVSSIPSISQGIHPVSGLPAFFIHPCKTEEWMKLMGERDNIYDLWYQTFGQVVGLGAG